MFGLILPSRPVLAEPQIISQTQYVYTIPSIPSFSHIVLFLLPGNSLPENAAAGIYIKFPGGTEEFRLLGAISNEKQSVIFKINSVSGVSDAVVMGEINGVKEVDMDAPEPGSGGIAGQMQGEITIGISIEPSVTLAPQLAALAMSQSQQRTHSGATSSGLVQQRQQPDTKLLAQRIIKNAFNFLAGFAGAAGGEEVVPLKSFEAWWRKFERRVEVDPTFLERDED